MIKGSRKNHIRKKSSTYFNFAKFEKLLDNLRKKGVDVTSVDYPVNNLKSHRDFKYFFENFSHQEIKSQLLFYCNQFDEFLENSDR